MVTVLDHEQLDRPSCFGSHLLHILPRNKAIKLSAIRNRGHSDVLGHAVERQRARMLLRLLHRWQVTANPKSLAREFRQSIQMRAQS